MSAKKRICQPNDGAISYFCQPALMGVYNTMGAVKELPVAKNYSGKNA